MSFWDQLRYEHFTFVCWQGLVILPRTMIPLHTYKGLLGLIPSVNPLTVAHSDLLTVSRSVGSRILRPIPRESEIGFCHPRWLLKYHQKTKVLKFCKFYLSSVNVRSFQFRITLGVYGEWDEVVNSCKTVRTMVFRTSSPHYGTVNRNSFSGTPRCLPYSPSHVLTHVPIAIQRRLVRK